MAQSIQPIEMVRGTTQSIVVSVTDEYGNPYELKKGEHLVFSVKTNRSNSECCLRSNTNIGFDGNYEFTLKPNDTLRLKCGILVYDVNLQSGNDFYPIIPCSPFMLLANVGQWEKHEDL